MRDGRMRCAMEISSRIASYHRASHPTIAQSIAHRILPSRIASYHRMILAVYMHGPSRPSYPGNGGCDTIGNRLISAVRTRAHDNVEVIVCVAGIANGPIPSLVARPRVNG